MRIFSIGALIVFAGQKLTPPAGLNLTPLSYKIVDLDNKDCRSFTICSGGP